MTSSPRRQMTRWNSMMKWRSVCSNRSRARKARRMCCHAGRTPRSSTPTTSSPPFPPPSSTALVFQLHRPTELRHRRPLTSPRRRLRSPKSRVRWPRGVDSTPSARSAGWCSRTALATCLAETSRNGTGST